MPVDILERTRKMLEDAPLEGENIDKKIRNLLKSEYLRKLAQYRRTDMQLTKKYNMSYRDFVERGIVESKDYSWDVESDAISWETSISGMKTMERRLSELQE